MSSRKEESLAEIISEDFLQCGICLEDLKSPKTLACLHTFCCDCLKAFHTKCSDQTVATCPTCRDETPLKDGDIRSLKDNFVLSNLQNVVSWMASDVAGKPSVCGNCEADGQRETAVVRCHDCDENLCGQCYKAHSRMKIAKNHKVEHLTSQDMMTTEKKTIVPSAERAGAQLDSMTFAKLQEFQCKSHSENVKLFCIKCEMPICLICYATEHTNHNCLNWKDAVQQECDKVRDILNEMGKKIHDAQSFLMTVTESVKQLEGHMSDVVNDIGNKRVAFYSLVDHYANSQIIKVRETLKGEIKQLDMKRNEITDGIEISRQEIHMAEQVLGEGSDGEKVALKKKLREKMQALQDMNAGFDVSHQGNRVQFQPGILTEGTIESLFGRVYVSKPKTPQAEHDEANTTPIVTANVVEARKPMDSMLTPVRIEPPTPPPKTLGRKTPLMVIETRTPSDNHASNITGLALMQNDNIALTDSANGVVKLFAHEGYILKEMRKSHNLLSPYSIAVSHDDKLLVTDGGSIKVALASAMGSDLVIDCKVNALGGIAIHPGNGNLYVTDQQRSNIYVCDARERRVIRALTEQGHLLSRGCTYLAINSNYQLVVSFPVSRVVKVFNLVPQLSLLGSYGPAGFQPEGLCIDRENNVIVTDMNANRVIVLSPTVQILRSVLLTEEDGIERPQVVAVDKQGRLIIGEEKSGKIKIFPYEKP